MAAIIKKHFGNDCLYAILNISKEASDKELKQAYKKLALLYHPDKNIGDKDATEKFQALSIIHSILSDPYKRDMYDSTGKVSDDEELGVCDDVSWYDYWRKLFPKVSTEDIENFETMYKGSLEEKKDILQAYTTHQGNMVKIINTVILADELEDEERFRQIINEAIANKEVEKYKEFELKQKSATKRKRAKKAKKEEIEAQDLFAAIKKKQKNSLTHRAKEFDTMISSLEQKYAKKNKKVKEPTEDEFKAISEKLNKTKKIR